MYIFSKSNKIDAVLTQQNDIYESSNESYITQKTEKCAAIRQISIQDEILQFTCYWVFCSFHKLKYCSVCNKSPNKLHKMPNIESNPTESMTVNEMPIQLLRPEICQFLQE